MSRTVSLGTLWALARRLANVESDPNIQDSELTTLANLHYPSVYDELVSSSPPDYFSATTTITTDIGTIVYPLLASFKDLLEVHVNESDDVRRPLYPMPHGARGRFKAPTGAWTISVDYIPAAVVLADAGDTVDGISGYEELIAALMARDVMVKRNADPSPVFAVIERANLRLKQMSKNRDKGHPKRTTDLDDAVIDWPWIGASGSRLACYRLRGDNLELYEPLSGLP